MSDKVLLECICVNWGGNVIRILFIIVIATFSSLAQSEEIEGVSSDFLMNAIERLEKKIYGGYIGVIGLYKNQ